MRTVFTKSTPGTKIAYLFLFLLIGIFIAGLLARLILLIPALRNGGEVISVYVYSITQSIFAIAMPAYLIALWSDPRPMYFLKLRKSEKMGQKLIFAILVFMLSYLFSSFLTQWNKGMSLPEWMGGIEEMMRSMEDAALATTYLLLSGKSIASLLLNLLVIAAIAAVCEEMFFRGALQQFVQEKFKNGHLAVWITATVFSLVHFQFYGFLPRLFLGALLGYLFLYTKNLWIPILFHFLNNATVILIYFFLNETEWFQKIDEAPVTPGYTGLAMVSLLFTLLLFYLYNKYQCNKQTSKNNNNDTDSR